MLKTTLVATALITSIVVTSLSAVAAPKCKDGTVFSEEAGKCIKAPRGS
jgi:hypothetical protein